MFNFKQKAKKVLHFFILIIFLFLITSCVEYYEEYDGSDGREYLIEIRNNFNSAKAETAEREDDFEYDFEYDFESNFITAADSYKTYSDTFDAGIEELIEPGISVADYEKSEITKGITDEFSDNEAQNNIGKNKDSQTKSEKDGDYKTENGKDGAYQAAAETNEDSQAKTEKTELASNESEAVNDEINSVSDYSSYGNIVWIPTKGGKKYHSKSSCSGMISPKQVSLSEAKALGFTACKRCH